MRGTSSESRHASPHMHSHRRGGWEDPGSQENYGTLKGEEVDRFNELRLFFEQHPGIATTTSDPAVLDKAREYRKLLAKYLHMGPAEGTVN